jgi:hypothetical protein
MNCKMIRIVLKEEEETGRNLIRLGRAITTTIRVIIIIIGETMGNL